MNLRFLLVQLFPHQSVSGQRTRTLFYCLSVGIGVALSFATRPTLAADSVRLNYGPLSRSIPVSDLREFAETGEASRKLRKYMKVSRQDPDKVQETLTNPIAMNPVQLDRLLNSTPGDLLLKEVGDVIHTPSDRSNQQALRSALILDASDDQQITLIDTIENYPTPEVEVEGDRLVKVIRRFNQVKAYGEDAQKVLGQEAQPLLENLLRRIDSFLK
ncbi:MAG: alpha/beta hydrolase [Cyanobacteria bacterium P01_A01_bin.17]